MKTLAFLIAVVCVAHAFPNLSLLGLGKQGRGPLDILSGPRQGPGPLQMGSAGQLRRMVMMMVRLKLMRQRMAALQQGLDSMGLDPNLPSILNVGPISPDMGPLSPGSPLGPGPNNGDISSYPFEELEEDTLLGMLQRLCSEGPTEVDEQSVLNPELVQRIGSMCQLFKERFQDFMDRVSSPDMADLGLPDEPMKFGPLMAAIMGALNNQPSVTNPGPDTPAVPAPVLETTTPGVAPPAPTPETTTPFQPGPAAANNPGPVVNNPSPGVTPLTPASSGVTPLTPARREEEWDERELEDFFDLY